MQKTTRQLLISSTLAAALVAGSAMAKSPAEWQALTAPVTVSLSQAVGSAIKLVPGKVIGAELDDGDGAGTRYELEVLTPAGESVEVWVNAGTGQAVLHKNDGKAKRKDVKRSQEASQSIEQAITAATAHTAGKPVAAELDNHWGKTVYQVDVLQADGTLMELKVDAVDGKVIRAKKD